MSQGDEVTVLQNNNQLGLMSHLSPFQGVQFDSSASSSPSDVTLSTIFDR